ncbi:MAG: trypsin-like peptidase domain-containing protein [Pirellulales bacterium]
MVVRCSPFARAQVLKTLCAARRRKAFVGLVLGLTLGTGSAQAQISLRADGDSSSLSSMTSSRENSSRETYVVHNEREREYRAVEEEASFLERYSNHVRRVAQLVGPTVVHIEASKRSPGNGTQTGSRVEEAGAGVIVQIDNSLFVLTNRHVVHPADINSIRLELNDGRAIRPTKIWSDPSTDVAVLQISGENLIPARLGNSDGMAKGDFVLAVGSPFGLSHSVTYGILSAKHRRNLELGSRDIEIQDFFQTDAAINPGNSGGPLLNLRGEVIGINTAIASNSGGNEGIGFSIPINMAMQVAQQLINHGKLHRAYLGVQLENAFNNATARQLGLPTTQGALVKAIIPRSPAEKAGLRVGDVVLQFDGTEIENDGHLVKTVGLTPVGKQVPILIFRDHQKAQLSIMLEPSPEQ